MSNIYTYLKTMKRRKTKMIHLNWENKETIKQIECVHTNAKKYMVNNKLTPGKKYDVKHESEAFYFIVDNSERIGGYLKEYFREVTT